VIYDAVRDLAENPAFVKWLTMMYQFLAYGNEADEEDEENKEGEEEGKGKGKDKDKDKDKGNDICSDLEDDEQ
jgi:hypothetical protein